MASLKESVGICRTLIEINYHERKHSITLLRVFVVCPIIIITKLLFRTYRQYLIPTACLQFLVFRANAKNRLQKLQFVLALFLFVYINPFPDFKKILHLFLAFWLTIFVLNVQNLLNPSSQV